MAWLNPQLGAIGRARLDTGYGTRTRTTATSRRTWLVTSLMLGFTMAAALASYMVSMQVSGERAEIETLQSQNSNIIHELKALDAELRVRMRLPQLQRWNDDVLGLLPISAQQYLHIPAQLAEFGAAPEANPLAPPRSGGALSYAIAKPAAPSATLQRTSAEIQPATAPAASQPPTAQAARAAPHNPAPQTAPQPAPQHIRDNQPILHLASAPAETSLPAPVQARQHVPARSAGLDNSLIAAIDKAAAQERNHGTPTDLLRLVSFDGPVSTPDP